MSPRAVWFISSVVLAGLVGCAREPAREPVQVTQEEWDYGGSEGAKLVTEHFDIHTTLSDVPLREALPAFLEAAYDQYASLVPPAEDLPRLQTYVFNNRRQWERFSRERFPMRFPVYARISAGGFSEGNLCVVYYLQRMYTLSVLAHEGMHQYLANGFSDPVPAWLNEGLATYSEAFELRNDDPVFTPQRNTFRLNALREALSTDTVLPVRQMLATDAGQVILEGRSRLTKSYYAQAWALVVFIRHGAEGRYAPGFDRLLDDLATGKLRMTAQATRVASEAPSRMSYGEAVFRTYITEDLEQFESEFEDHLYELAGFRRPETRS